MSSNQIKQLSGTQAVALDCHPLTSRRDPISDVQRKAAVSLRAVDQDGAGVDILATAHRQAAKKFRRKRSRVFSTSTRPPSRQTPSYAQPRSQKRPTDTGPVLRELSVGE